MVTVSISVPRPAKFAVPVATQVVPRPRLHARLTAGTTGPVRLITAAAGWGKTLLAASWVAAGAGDRATAWVSLDAGDDDIRTFWPALATALLPVTGPASATALRQVIASAALDAEALPHGLASALQVAERPVVLVLDNLHEVSSPAVHAGLLRLIGRPPPGLSLLITTRRDPPWPIPQLRLAGLLTVVGPTELAFDDTEAAALFAQLGIDLAAQQRQRLVERTEGWVAGLRLVALDLQDRHDVEAAIAVFSGDDHSVADYLVGEVLGRQPAELVTFLRRISAVEVVCVELAEALTDRGDSADVLAELAACHLFVQAVDRPGRWYRLHRLIADLLRARPVPRREHRDLQRRAAEWFHRNGMPLEAIRSAVAGHLWPLAAELVGTQTVALALGGAGRELEQALAGLPPDVLAAHPELAAGLAGARVVQGNRSDVDGLLGTARTGMRGLPPRRTARTRVLAGLAAAGSARLDGDWGAAVAAYRDMPVDASALARLGIAGARVVPVTVANNIGSAALWSGELSTADEHLRAAVGTDLPAPPLSQLNAAAHLALLGCARGELDPAQAQAQNVIATAVRAGQGTTPQVIAAYLALAAIAVDRDDLGDADHWLDRVADVEALAPESHVRLAAALVLAARREAAGEREQAFRGLRATAARIEDRPLPGALTQRWLLTEATMLARSGDRTRARALLARVGRADSTSGVLAARLELLLDDLPAAAAARASIGAPGHPRAQVDLAVLDTLLAAAAGDEAQALDRLEDALVAAAPWGLRHAFLTEGPGLQARLRERIGHGTVVPDFALDLLARMSGAPSARPGPSRAMVDPLTERERRILGYLAGALSSAEIAAELYVSTSTVLASQHVLYRKLGTASRRAAVLRATELRLL